MTDIADPAEPEAAARAQDALTRAWAALDRHGDKRAEKARLVALLERHSDLVPRGRRDDLLRLATDPEVDPAAIAPAGWCLIRGEGGLDPGPDPSAVAKRLEGDSLALALLRETYVSSLAVERPLTEVRRWLLLSGSSEDYPELTAALVAQAAHNGGAWLFDEKERHRLQDSDANGMRAAYLPRRPHPATSPRYADPVTQAVADQYRSWPCPVWTRITRVPAQRLPEVVEKIDPQGPPPLPAAAEILVAGCGTGREAALAACRFPEARITAIDISEVSLDYARERCAADIDFRRLDLYRTGDLGRAFDMILCSGVLHHLPNPEAGWAALHEVLKPGGVMRIMVYSRLGRLRVQAARRHFVDLLDRPVDDDLLREVRRRLIDRAPALLHRSADFYPLGHVHDLLLHRQEDPFDTLRIARGCRRLGLQFLGFELPTAEDRKRYRAAHPDDPLFRDFDHWAALERRNPFLFAGMYAFWCRKPAASADREN
ncbi:MAG TPA: class I SAM-dependent methyltransferase [Allosphingosinicella sp.]|nr:class I SAM-dependent methyltransferase [Allosphingosinicella sp.]